MKPDQAKRDLYRRLAKQRGFKSRAAFKLIQLQEKYGIIKKGDRVLDLGCAPGGWLQVSSSYVGKEGIVIGIDKKPVRDMPENVRTIEMDIFNDVFKAIREITTSEFDVVLSDLSPDVSGVWELDSARQIELCERALEIAKGVLKKGGKMVIKIFQGEDTRYFIKKLRKAFKHVKLTKPPASRPESSELYVICFGFKG